MILSAIVKEPLDRSYDPSLPPQLPLCAHRVSVSTMFAPRFPFLDEGDEGEKGDFKGCLG